jgi:hypothetical protein
MDRSPPDATYDLNRDPQPVCVSCLPGVHERPVPDGLEQRFMNALYGRSFVQLARVGRMRLEHVVDPIRWSPELGSPTWSGWRQVAKQRLFVWATLDGRPRIFLGGLELRHPNHTEDLRYLQHPTVWSAFGVNVNELWRGRHIGRSLYAHAHAFGYELGKDQGTDDGRRLWDSMDAGWKNPQRVTFAGFSEAALVTITARFGPGERRLELRENLRCYQYGLGESTSSFPSER